jgi:hypothetical protein
MYPNVARPSYRLAYHRRSTMFRQARTIALIATLASAALMGCHSNTQGAVTVALPNGTTQVIPAGQPIPVGATVITSGTTAAVPLAPGTAPSDAPVAPGMVAQAPAPSQSPAPNLSAAPNQPPPTPSLVVPAGTRVTIRTTETLSAEHGGGVGSGFSGVLNSPITVRGVVAFPRGTAVRGEIVSANGRGHFTGDGVLGLELRTVGGYRVETSEYVRRIHGRGKRTAGFIGGGAGIGALIGGLAGGGKGALIGGMAGAGGGTVAGAYTGHRDVVLPSESAISFTLRNSISLQ